MNGRVTPGGAPSWENPFVEDSPENHDLSYLALEEGHLIHAVKHYEARLRLREGILLDFMTGAERTARAWESLVTAARAVFVPAPWMLPSGLLKAPAVLNGIYDFFPIGQTSPEIYDKLTREVMAANGQHPWVVVATLNVAHHAPEAFLRWVDSELIPSLRKAAREVARNHFDAQEGGEGARGIRVRTRGRGRDQPLCGSDLRRRLRAVACHQIRHCAAADEPVAVTFERYRRALPLGVRDDMDPDAFRGEMAAVAEASRAHWRARLGDVALRNALRKGWLRLP